MNYIKKASYIIGVLVAVIGLLIYSYRLYSLFQYGIGWQQLFSYWGIGEMIVRLFFALVALAAKTLYFLLIFGWPAKVFIDVGRDKTASNTLILSAGGIAYIGFLLLVAFITMLFVASRQTPSDFSRRTLPGIGYLLGSGASYVLMYILLAVDWLKKRRQKGSSS